MHAIMCDSKEGLYEWIIYFLTMKTFIGFMWFVKLWNYPRAFCDINV